jgi:hypothetical protein
MRRSGAIRQGFAASLQALLLLRTALDAQLQMLTPKTTNVNNTNQCENTSSQPADANPHTVAEAALSALDAARKEKDNDE